MTHFFQSLFLCLLCFGVIGIGGCGQLPAGLGESESAVKVCAHGATTLGMDVSHWDGAIDFSAIKAAGVEFAFMKATEGTDFLDPEFATYWKDAAQSGVIRGAYHYFHPATDPTMQADYFVQTAGIPADGDFPLTLDLEITDDLSGPDAAASALVFLERVEALTGKKPIIYTSARVFDTLLGTPAGFDSYTLWVSNWQVTCPNLPKAPWTDWRFWQTSDAGRIIDGGSLPTMGSLDLDVFNGSLSDLQTFVSPPPPMVDAGHEDSQPRSDGSTTEAIVDGASIADDLSMNSTSAGDGSMSTVDSGIDSGAQGNIDAQTTVPPMASQGCACDLGARPPHDSNIPNYPWIVSLSSLFVLLIRRHLRRQSPSLPFTLLLVLSIALGSASLAAAKAPPPKNRFGLTVLVERNKEGGVRVTLNASLPQPISVVESTLLDCRGYPGWVPGLVSVRPVTVESACGIIEANLTCPWPIGKVKEVIHLDRQEKDGDISIVWQRLRGDLKRNDAAWTLHKKDDTHTDVRYIAVFQPQRFIPDFLLRRAERELAPVFIDQFAAKVALCPGALPGVVTVGNGAAPASAPAPVKIGPATQAVNTVTTQAVDGGTTPQSAPGTTGAQGK